MPPPVWYPFGVYREGKALTQPKRTAPFELHRLPSKIYNLPFIKKSTIVPITQNYTVFKSNTFAKL